MMRTNIGAIALAAAVSACGGSQADATTSGFSDDVAFEEEREAPSARHPATETVERGEAALAAGEVRQAKMLFEQAVAADGRDARARLDLGLVLELEDDMAGAEAQYRAALSIDAEFPEALNNLGLLLRDRQSYDEAIPLLERAVALRPSYAAALLNLALALEESGRKADAIEAYRRAVRAAPEDPMPRVNLGLLLLSERQVDAARIELRRALPNADGDAAMLQAIGNGLRRAGDAELALRALEGAVEAADPATPSLRSELALAQYAAGQKEAAEATLRAVIAEAPRYATAHYLLGTILLERGDATAGARSLRRVIELEPEGPHAERARAQLEASRRR